jgi:hypothetical protein
MSVNYVTKSTILYDDRRVDYKAGDTINLYIPPSIALVDTKNTFLNFRLQFSGELKTTLGRAGIYGLIRQITVSDGTNQKILEQLPNYSAINALRLRYAQNESERNLCVLHEGQPSSDIIKKTVGNQYINASKADDEVYYEVEVNMPFHCVGCLDPKRESVFPNIATAGLNVEILLNDSVTALQVMGAKYYDSELNEVEPTAIAGYTRTYAYRLDAQFASGGQTCTLKSDKDVNEITTNGIYYEQDETIAHLFKIGQSVTIEKDDGSQSETLVVDNVSVNSDNKLEVVFTTQCTVTHDANSNVFINVRPDTENFTIKDLRLMVGYVVPPAGYVQNLLKRIQGKGLSFDIHTYQCYSVNIAGGSLNNSLYINARNNRSQAILSIPFKSDSNSYTEDSNIPDKEKVRDYFYTLYQVMCPDKPVNLRRLNVDGFNATHLKEIESSLVASGIGCKNLYENWKHFFIGRKLANKSYSYNANRPDEGQIRIDLNYLENGSKGILLENFLFGKRQIIIQNNNIQIVY